MSGRTTNNKLFLDKILDKYAKRVEIGEEQRKALGIWVNMLKKQKLVNEQSNYPVFQKYVLEDMLGYTLDDFTFESGDVEFTISGPFDKPLLPIELKGQNTNLFARQGSRGKTSLEQAYGYALEKDTKYFSASNYASILFLMKESYYSKYEIFDFAKMEKNDLEFKKFLLLFSRKSLIEQDTPSIVRTEIIQKEKDFTEEFYKLYHETRLMIIKELEDQVGLSKVDAVHHSQILLNRIMFICFAQDSEKNLLTPLILENTLLRPIEQGYLGEHSYNVWMALTDLFTSIRLGDRVKNIPRYNGGLFLEHISDKIKIRDVAPSEEYFENIKQGSIYSDNDLSSSVRKRLGGNIDHVNPIYKNILLISSFDFKSEVDINILGHIFEQSIGDLEDLKLGEMARTQRKKFGIFYTREYITDYICRNTIISLLTKTGKARDILDLIYEYANDLEELELKLKRIKIVDPACGSGAFLNKAVDVLLEIHKAIFEFREFKGKYKTVVMHKKGKKKLREEGVSLHKFIEDIELQREIILNNIYGVDINEESVEITKLSLFLKIASRGITLPNLDNNIRCGNSLIEDEKLGKSKPFIWANNFSEICSGGEGKGFDIIIGNPPYNAKLSENEKKYMKEKFPSLKSGDTAEYFSQKSISLLSPEGLFGFILPKSLAYYGRWKGIRKFLMENTTILKIANVGLGFEDVNYEEIILLCKREKAKDNYSINIEEFDNLKNPKLPKSVVKHEKIDSVIMEKNGVIIFSPLTKNEEECLQTIDDNSVKFSEVMEDTFRGIYISDSDKSKLRVGDCQFIEKEPWIQRYGVKSHVEIDVEEDFIKEKKIKELLRKKLIFKVLRGNRLSVHFDEKGRLITPSNIVNVTIKDHTEYDYYSLLGIFNSSLVSFYVQKAIFSNTTESARHMDRTYLSLIPIPKHINEKQKNDLSKYVRKMLSLKRKQFIQESKKIDVSDLKKDIGFVEEKIDSLVYELYGLKPNEIETISKKY